MSIEKYFEEVSKQVRDDLQKEINSLAWGKSLHLFEMKDGLLGEVVYHILEPSFTELKNTFGAVNTGPINLNNIMLKIDPYKKTQYRFNSNDQFLLNIFSTNNEDDKNLRLGFYGGEAKDKEGETLIISPMSHITYSVTARENAIKLQNIFTKKVE